MCRVFLWCVSPSPIAHAHPLALLSGPVQPNTSPRHPSPTSAPPRPVLAPLLHLAGYAGQMNTTTPNLEQLVADGLQLASDVEHHVKGQFHCMTLDRDNDFGVFCAATVARCIIYFRGVRTLVQSDLIEPAGAVARVMLEHWFVVGAVASNPELFEALANQSAQEHHKAMDALASMMPIDRPDWLTPESIEATRSTVTRPKANSKGNGFSPKFWADRAGESDTFALIYRRLSSCAHGALHPLDYYVRDGIGDDPPVVQIGNMHAALAPQLLQISSSIVLGLLGFLAPDSTIPDSLVKRVKAYDVLLRELAEQTPPP